MFGSELYQAFRTVKATFDPTGIFNPGRIVDTPPITSHLRFGAGYDTPDPVTSFDFSGNGGFGRAVEMCSGVGMCRKKQDGTMCPSFMVTQEEAHSTRGRANVLRLAMSGRLGEAELSDHAVHEVLDLCLECRACKSECPVNVDVARFKSEFMSATGTAWDAASRPGARQRQRACTLGKPAGADVERPASSAIGRRLTEEWLGIDRRRTPPIWARRTMRDRLSSVPPRQPAPRAVLFADTFTNFSDPEIGVAAFELLNLAVSEPGLRHTCAAAARSSHRVC
jgi:Fe-S oxidoreductase